MPVVYLEREAITESKAKRLNGMAKRQADRRMLKGQLSVLIDRKVLEAWREYVKDRQEEDEGLTAADIVEELLERELRRKKRW